MRTRLCWAMCALGLLLLSGTPRAQRPFYTDDADVTPRGRFQFVWSNQFNWLRTSARPALRQNTADFELDYGLLWQGLELDLESPLLTIVSARPSGGRKTVSGIGDTSIGLKYQFLEEQPDNPWPAIAGSVNVEFPTGNKKQGLGSGLIDVSTNSVVQKFVTQHMVVRANFGLQFLGDESTGAVGLTSRGVTTTLGASVVREFTERLRLGVEMFAAMPNEFAVRRGLLQLQTGGNYQLVEALSLEFGVIRGFYGPSPTVALQIGMSTYF